MAVFSRVWGNKGIGDIVKHDVLERLYGDKCVNYCVFDGAHCKNTVKNNALEGFLVYMFELASGIATWKN